MTNHNVVDLEKVRKRQQPDRQRDLGRGQRWRDQIIDRFTHTGARERDRYGQSYSLLDCWICRKDYAASLAVAARLFPALKLADLLEGEVVVPFDFQEIAAELAAFDPKDDEDREIIDLCYRRHLALIVNGFADRGRRTDLVRACDVAAAVTVDLTGPRLAEALRRDDRFGNYRHEPIAGLSGDGDRRPHRSG
jgi:hypothetical protein